MVLLLLLLLLITLPPDIEYLHLHHHVRLLRRVRMVFDRRCRRCVPCLLSRSLLVPVRPAVSRTITELVHWVSMDRDHRRHYNDFRPSYEVAHLCHQVIRRVVLRRLLQLVSPSLDKPFDGQ